MYKGKNEEGGAAFPTSWQEQGMWLTVAGMSLRDWFAGQALAGLCAKEARDKLPMTISKKAYILADEMLKAKEKNNEQ